MMNRRNFLKTTAITGIALAMGDNLWANVNANRNKNWIWTGVDAKASDEELLKRFQTLKEHGITGVFMGGDDERSFKLLKEAGLEAHLWMWTMNRRDKELMENHADWYAINRLGDSCHDKPPYVDYYRWLCPSKPEVIEYLEKDVARLAAKPYIEGIHLDYVRYCDVILPRDLWEKYDLVQKKELPQFDYCYCETCCAKFKAETGIDPKALKNPSGSSAWKEYRYDSITNIVNKLAKVVRATGKPISAAVFPSPSIAKKLVRQDWTKWDLDMIFPMLYHSFYREKLPWIRKEANEGVKALDDKFPLYAGLYLPALKTPEELKEAMLQAQKGGAKGVSLFGELSERHWKAFEEGKIFFD
jgi:uncharacterized lipoprotein YddW (UPF0748 family)